MNLHDACDYIITKVCEGGVELNALKLQKLLYYSQAWHLAFEKKPLFEGKFQAWVHGPVSREIYDRFASSKSLYSSINLDDRNPNFDLSSLSDDDKNCIDNVLEVYAGYSGTQLEDMTHREKPWIEARKGYPASARCEVEVKEDTMRQYYGSLLPQ